MRERLIMFCSAITSLCEFLAYNLFPHSSFWLYVYAARSSKWKWHSHIWEHSEKSGLSPLRQKKPSYCWTNSFCLFILYNCGALIASRVFTFSSCLDLVPGCVKMIVWFGTALSEMKFLLLSKHKNHCILGIPVTRNQGTILPLLPLNSNYFKCFASHCKQNNSVYS